MVVTNTETFIWSNLLSDVVSCSRIFTNLPFNSTGRSLAMEPNDGNLYVIDDDSQHILLVDVKRKIVKTIMKPDKNSTNVTNIKQITIDLREK